MGAVKRRSLNFPAKPDDKRREMGIRIVLAAFAAALAAPAAADMPGMPETEMPGATLLNNGESSSARSARQERLYQAAFRGKLDEVKTLLSSKARPNEPTQGSYPLSAACVNGHLEVVRTLIGAALRG